MIQIAQLARFTVSLLVMASASMAADTASAPQLNVVFLLADDLGWGEFGCYGQRKIPTPNIDRLKPSRAIRGKGELLAIGAPPRISVDFVMAGEIQFGVYRPA